MDGWVGGWVDRWINGYKVDGLVITKGCVK